MANAAGCLKLALLSFIHLFNSPKFLWRRVLYREKVLPDASSQSPDASSQLPAENFPTLNNCRQSL